MCHSVLGTERDTITDTRVLAMWSNEDTNKSMITHCDKGNKENLKSLMTILKGDLIKKPGKVLLAKKRYLIPK